MARDKFRAISNFCAKECLHTTPFTQTSPFIETSPFTETSLLSFLTRCAFQDPNHIAHSPWCIVHLLKRDVSTLGCVRCPSYANQPEPWANYTKVHLIEAAARLDGTKCSTMGHPGWQATLADMPLWLTGQVDGPTWLSTPLAEWVIWNLLTEKQFWQIADKTLLTNMLVRSASW